MYPYDPNAQTWSGMPPQPPVKPPSHMQRLFSWYRSRSPRGKMGYGCLGLIVLLLLCSCTASIAQSITGINFTGDQTSPFSQQDSSPTQTDTSDNQVVTISTDTPVPDLPTPTPKPKPTKPPTHPKPTPTPKPKCQAVNNNPWCYNFTPGSLIYNPPGNFCDYFSCIASFWTSTNGYVNECSDETYSHSGGVRGDCSRHGGMKRPLYQH